MVIHGPYDHSWVNFHPCECGDPGPQDVFDFLDSPKGRAWKAEGDATIARMNEDEPEGHVAHVEYGEPDPDCDECQEAAAMRWEDLMRPY